MSEDAAQPPRTSFPAGARCAHHPDRLAQRLCARCGNYMCGECNVGSASGLCLACVARVGVRPGFPYTRDNYTLDGLLNFALSRWKPRWLMLALSYAGVMMLAFAVVAAFALAFDIVPDVEAIAQGTGPLREPPWQLQFALDAVLVVTQLAAALVLSGTWLDVLEGVPSTAERIWLRLRALPAQLLVTLIFYGVLLLCGLLCFGVFQLFGAEAGLPASFFASAACALLLVPVLCYAMLGAAFVTFELAHDPQATALSALRTSFRAVRGRRWVTFGVLSTAGLISSAGVLACCAGVVVSAPLGMMLWGALFLALKQPTPQDSGVVTQEWPV